MLFNYEAFLELKEREDENVVELAINIANFVYEGNPVNKPFPIPPNRIDYFFIEALERGHPSFKKIAKKQDLMGSSETELPTIQEINILTAFAKSRGHNDLKFSIN